LCVCVIGGLAGCILAILARRKEPELRSFEAWAAGLGFLGTLAIVLGALRAAHIQFSKIFYSLVLFHVNVSVRSRAWFLPPGLAQRWIPWTAICLLLAIFVTRLPPGRRSPVVAALQFFFAPLALALRVFHSGAAAGFVAGLTWLVLFPAHEDAP